MEKDQQLTTEQLSQINDAIRNASSDAIESDIIIELLTSKATIDDKGDVLINGKNTNQAVADLIKQKPFLAKPTTSLSAVERLKAARSKQQGGK